MLKKIALALTTVALLFGFTACTEDDSDVVNHNLTKSAKNFELMRKVEVVNGITDKVILSVEGRCDLDPKSGRVFITCKVAKDSNSPDSYKRNQIYLSDNVFVSVEQLDAAQVSAYHYRYTLKPQSLIPDVDFRGSTDELPQKQD